MGPWGSDAGPILADSGPPDIIRRPRRSSHTQQLAGAESRLHTLKTAFELFCDSNAGSVPRLSNEELQKALVELHSKTELGAGLLSVEATMELPEAREAGLDLYGFLGLLRRATRRDPESAAQLPALPLDAKEAVLLWGLVEESSPSRFRPDVPGSGEGELDAGQVRGDLRCIGSRLSEASDPPTRP